jgi:glycosyltransferase involved in cell wall biosynthesis
MSLSILICSLDWRKEQLHKLMVVLSPQLKQDTQVIIDMDSGEIPIGAKRNRLLEKARGDYICFVDDDDLVSDNYIEKIYYAKEDGVDCIGMSGIVTFNGRNPHTFIQSINYNRWFEKDGIYFRCPNHLNPIKREIALQVKFEPINFQEDRVYSSRIYPLLKTETYINGPIYFYNFIKGKSDQKLKLRGKRGVDIEPLIRTWSRF